MPGESGTYMYGMWLISTGSEQKKYIIESDFIKDICGCIQQVLLGLFWIKHFFFLHSVWTQRNKKLGVYILFGMCYSTIKLNMVLHWCICKDIFPDIGMTVHSTFPGYLEEKNIKYMT